MLENIFSCRLLSCDKTKHFHWHFTQSLSLVKTKVKQFLKNCWDWTLIEMKLHCLFASFFPFLIASNIRYLKFIIGVRGLFSQMQRLRLFFTALWMRFIPQMHPCWEGWRTDINFLVQTLFAEVTKTVQSLRKQLIRLDTETNAQLLRTFKY